jgi:hypothetical protein
LLKSASVHFGKYFCQAASNCDRAVFEIRSGAVETIQRKKAAAPAPLIAIGSNTTPMLRSVRFWRCTISWRLNWPNR